MFTLRIVVIALFLALGACASSPSYVAANGADDYGHHSRKIAENRYRVNYNGNRRLSYEDTRDYTLLRAAELTLAEGNDWFQVVDREAQTTETKEPETRIGFERAYYVEQNCGLVSCTRSVRPTTYGRMEFDTHRRPETKHVYSMEIVMGKGEMPEDGHYYDASSVVKALDGNM